MFVVWGHWAILLFSCIYLGIRTRIKTTTQLFPEKTHLQASP